jgi:arginine repressor
MPLATSGSINYNQTRNELIYDALALIGVYGVGRTISAEDMQFSSNMLNKMIKTYQADGLHLWAKEEGYLFVADNTGNYTVSADSTSARTALRSDSQIQELTIAASAGASSVAVNTTTGMAVNDIIGIVSDDDTVSWGTISAVNSSTSLGIAPTLSADAAIGSKVYVFTL